jgi:hypothetical protein
MSIRNKLLAIAAVTALSAATAVPAMALENEFHGMMAVRGYNSNYLSGTAGRINIDGDTTTSKTWIEQRARIFYSAKANDDLKLVTAFELDSYWGKGSYDNLGGRNQGGALGSDTVSIETKWTYLDFNCPITGTNFKVGMQGLNDGYKGLIFGLGADAAGVLASKSVGPIKGTFGWFRLDDSNSAGRTATSFTNGKTQRDLWLLAGDVNVTKDIKLGASYYFLNNDGVPSTNVSGVAAFNSYDVHILGASVAANLGVASVDAFGIYEFGNAGTMHVNAFAGSAAAKVKAGPATVKMNALYVSGNNSPTGAFGGNAFVSVNNTTSGVGAENGMNALGGIYLLVRNPKETTNEQALIAESGNLNQGIIGGSVGADLVLGKVFANTNVGMVFNAKKANKRNTYIGTEINGEVGYKLYDNLTASVRAAYVLLGDYYNDKSTLHPGTDPANPYETQLVLSYNF